MFRQKKEKREVANETGTVLLACCLVAQFVFIQYCNFTGAERFLDYDSSIAIRHAVEMWRNHTIFLNDFVYTTSMEIDCASFFAAPIYILTGNLSISIGLAHLVLDTILLMCIYCLLYNLHVDIKYRLLGILLFFTPYAYGQLNYDNMLFLSVGQYEFRVLTAVSILMVLMYEDGKWKKWHFVGWLLSVCSLFWTALSTGKYICMVLLAPIILHWMLTSISGQKFDKRKMFLFLCWMLTVLIAFALQKSMSVNINRTNMRLTSYSEFIDVFFDMFKGIFLLFGGLTQGEIEVISLEGISIIVRFLYTVIILIVPILSLKRNLIDNNKRIYFTGDVFFITLVNMFVLTLADVKYGSRVFPCRYHLVWGSCWIFLSVVCIDQFMKRESNYWLKRSAWIVMGCGLVIMNGSGMRELNQVLGKQHMEREYFLREADQLRVDNVVVFNDLSTAHILNALDIDKNIRGIFINEDDGTYIVDTWGNFANPNLSPHHMFIVPKEVEEKISADIISNYQLIEEYDRWNIYVTEGYQW